MSDNGGFLARLAASLGNSLFIVLCWLLGLILSAMVLLETIQVALRYGFGTGFVWTGDVGVLLMQALAWIGAPALWLRRSHISIDLSRHLFGARFGFRLFRMLDVVIILGGVSLLYVGTDVLAAFRLTEIPSLGLSGDVRYYPIMASAVLLVLAAAINLTHPEDPDHETGADR